MQNELRDGESKARTAQQNRALHKYFRQLASDLNNAGYDMKRTLKHDVPIPWNEAAVKEHLWKPIMRAMTDQTSTTDLDTREIDQIFQVLSQHLATKTGVTTGFPHREDL